METAFKVVLDIYEVQNQATISIKQGDTSGKLYITLCAYREKYIIPEGATAVLRMLKNGSPVFKACDIQENVITCDIGFATEFVGAHDVELAIYKDGKVLLTQTLIVKVYSNVYGNTDEGEIVDSEPFSALTELVSEATDLIHEVETKLENGDFVGEKGEKGDQGIQGEKGDKGDKGDQGEKGEDGKDGTIITVNGEEQSTWNADTKADVEEVEGVREETNTLRDEVLSIYGDLSHASTRIENVEQDTKLVKEVLFNKGVIAVAEVEQAYTSRVTADGQNIVDGQKTPVTMIKGSTVRCENLLIFPYANASVGTYTNNGITFTVNADGTVLVNGTATSRARLVLKYVNQGDYSFKSGIYTLSGVPFREFNGGYGELQFAFIYAYGTSDAIYGSWNGKTYELTQEAISYYLEINVAGGQTANNWLFKPMLNVGSTALPYQPYFTDLKHAKIDGIVSTGRNLFDKSKAKDGYEISNIETGTERINAEWFVTDLIQVLPNTKYVVSGKKNGVAVCQYDLNKNSLGINDGGGANGSFTTTANTYFVKLNGLLTEKDTFQLEVGSTATEYTPFIQETYQLPETLELGEWDSFNPQTGEITRATGRYVITGNESWNNQTSGNTLRFAAMLPTNGTTGNDSTANLSIVCSHLKTAEAQNKEGVWIVGGYSDILPIRVVDSRFATAEDFANYLKEQYANGTPVTIEYLLATPTVEKLENTPKSYTAYNQGNETAVLENEEFGAIPTITNEYIVVL